MSFLRQFSPLLARLDPDTEIPDDVLTNIALAYVQCGGQMTPGLFLELSNQERGAFRAAIDITWRMRAREFARALTQPEGLAQLEAPLDNAQALHDLVAEWVEDQI